MDHESVRDTLVLPGTMICTVISLVTCHAKTGNHQPCHMSCQDRQSSALSHVMPRHAIISLVTCHAKTGNHQPCHMSCQDRQSSALSHVTPRQAIISLVTCHAKTNKHDAWPSQMQCSRSELAQIPCTGDEHARNISANSFLLHCM